jgi:hypothetical protein
VLGPRIERVAVGIAAHGASLGRRRAQRKGRRRLPAAGRIT